MAVSLRISTAVGLPIIDGKTLPVSPLIAQCLWNCLPWQRCLWKVNINGALCSGLCCRQNIICSYSTAVNGHNTDLAVTKNYSTLSAKQLADDKIQSSFYRAWRQHTDARYWYSNSVCSPSVRHSPVFCRNGLTYRYTCSFFTTR